jgi:hypothetical protein
MPLGTPARRMPIPEDVRDFLGDLLGKPVSVSKKPVTDLSSIDLEEEKWVTGLYVNDKNALIGACLADLKLAANCGAALAMISEQVAKESIAAGELGDNLRENFYEVVNIVSAMLNGPSVPHLRLTELVDGIPDDVIELSKRAAGNKRYDITIVGYDGGTLGLIGV